MDAIASLTAVRRRLFEYRKHFVRRTGEGPVQVVEATPELWTAWRAESPYARCSRTREVLPGTSSEVVGVVDDAKVCLTRAFSGMTAVIICCGPKVPDTFRLTKGIAMASLAQGIYQIGADGHLKGSLEEAMGVVERMDFQ